MALRIPIGVDDFRVLRELGGRVTEASQRLGIPRSTLYQKIKRFGIVLPRSS